MSIKRVRPLLLGLVFVLTPFTVPTAWACGHDGFYVGAGYEQLFLYTTESRLSGGSLGRITFGPGFGGSALLGYDFCGSRWGIQMPFEFSRFRLNNEEWVNSLGSSLEGVLHLAQWQNGLDIHLVGGAGWSYLTEGSVPNRTANAGITASLGPGVSYFIPDTKKVSIAIVAELPFRMIYYFGDRLSANGTTVLGIPLRLSVEVGF